MPFSTTPALFSGLQRLVDPLNLPESLANPVVAIGNFDGVHAGHRDLFRTALALARQQARPLVAVTFSPHPRQFFQPTATHFMLTPPDIQSRLLAEIGVNGIAVFTFDAQLAALTADDFIRDILVARLKARAVAVGADFHFGKGRSGSPQTLAAAGAAQGFSVSIVEKKCDAGGEISSSRVRKALVAGDIAHANAMLGYEWFITGEVIHGAKRGRELGYPTANSRLDDQCQLKHGIYAVRMRLDGKTWPAVASFGRRPTFDNGAALLEVHVFGYSGSLYGRTPDIAFVEYLRPEMAFDGIEPLIRQMDADSARAKEILASTKN